MTAVAADLFSRLPDSSRLWVFGAGRPLSPEEESRLLSSVDGFLEGWKAHGCPLVAAREWLYHRFLLVGIDDQVTPPSGCSIDALVSSLRVLEADLGTEIIGGASVWYRQNGPEGEIRRISRSAFKELAENGLVSGDTIVFDLSLTRVGELREGRWESSARQSWHQKYLS